MNRLNATRLGVATTIAVLIIWAICSLLVMLMGGMMMNMTGAMVHGDMSGMGWSLSLFGVIVGGLIWSLGAGVTAWLIALIYNALGPNTA